MKIKARPEDFIVEEILAVPPRERGPYALLRLKKRGLNTTDAIQQIAAGIHKPVRDLAYGGRKDKHADATQFITVKGKIVSRLPRHSVLHAEEIGYLDRPMGPDLIAGNRFRITVRDVNREEETLGSQRLKIISRDGFLNYFDNQRFGPYDPLQGFLAEKIIKGHFNGALKFHLTHSSSEDKKENLLKKKFFFDRWGEWNACRTASTTVWERLCFSRLASHPKDFLFLLRKIQSQEMAFHFASFQAFLWNEVLRRLVLREGSATSSYPGIAGDYVFDDEPRVPSALTIPTPASRLTSKDPQIIREYQQIFKERALKTSQFNLTKIRQSYFKSIERPARVTPDRLSFTFDNDETSTGKKKIALSFILPRGSYATMLIKRLFAHPEQETGQS
jgi:tRNA pseudouridine13 synthase